jgi:putative acetyltransferase
MNINIRPETAADIPTIHEINTAAFGQPAEAKLVDALRDAGAHLISLVAEQDNKVVGHILFSPVEIEQEIGVFKCAGLAPMAVLPEYQRQGVGKRLVTAGLDACRQNGIPACVVLGHPEYYPKFGFKPARNYGIDSDYDAPEAFMIIELSPSALEPVSGRAKYHPAFNNL